MTNELSRIQKYCAYQERSQQEVRDKLYSYGLHKREVEQIIAQLITDNFLNEERFAIAYAGGKFRMKQWGRNKIKAALKQKRVSDYCIRKALRQINERDYGKAMDKLIAEKARTVKENNALKKNYKVAQYVISRGFEAELVWERLNGGQ
jgi:regulatory protein